MTSVSDVRTTAEDERSHRARSSGRLIAGVAVVVVPAWGAFDHLLVPRQASTFVFLRLLADIPMLVCLWLLWARPLGRRRPEPLSFAVLAIVQGEIAFMVVRARGARDFYLLGFSLALYASGCLMGGRPRWTGAVVATTWLALGMALLTAPSPMSGRDLAAAGFYLATASIIGLAGHTQRHRLSIRELLARQRLIAEQGHTRQLLTRLERLGHEDSLTGLANRRRWDTDLQSACAHTRAGGPPLAVLLIDIDRFKAINDHLGHAGGDETLRAVGRLLIHRVREGDLVARLGGDEYGVLLLDSDAMGAAELAEQLRRDALQLRSAGDGPLTLSLGVAAAAGDEAEPDRLIMRADAQLYRAKATRNAIAV